MVVSPERIKKEIRNICESYSHPWDVLAELAQNSVDAISRWQDENKESSRNHFIKIQIDQKKKSIRFEDSGCGIDPRRMPQLLAPNETDKEAAQGLIGEKGVGLKFAIFSSNLFKIDTRSVSGSYSASMKDARKWRDSGSGDDVEVPDVLGVKKGLDPVDPSSTGTTVVLEDVETCADKVFTIDINRLAYLFRTKTAIGSTKKRFGKPGPNVHVELKVITEEGKTEEMEVPFEYYFPDSFFDNRSVIDMQEFIKKAPFLNDVQKINMLSGKCMKKEGTRDEAGKMINYFAFFVPSRDDWVQISRTHRLHDLGLTEVKLQDSDVGPGIFISTRGMPTGIELIPPATGYAGYWGNLFILLEYDHFSFDLGRKTVPGRTQGMLKDISKSLFNEMTNWRSLLQKETSAGPRPPEIDKFSRDAEFRELDNIANLNYHKINFQKQPYGQEAGVVAIFHELIGAGVLLGYRCLGAGYKKNYDFWGKYTVDKSFLGEEIQRSNVVPQTVDGTIVVEFKYDTASLIEDVQNNRKHFQAIDLIVCWELDENKFHQSNIEVEILPPGKVFYYGSNYVLTWPGIFGLGDRSIKPVLVLKRFIEDQIRKEA